MKTKLNAINIKEPLHSLYIFSSALYIDGAGSENICSTHLIFFQLLTPFSRPVSLPMSFFSSPYTHIHSSKKKKNTTDILWKNYMFETIVVVETKKGFHVLFIGKLTEAGILNPNSRANYKIIQGHDIHNISHLLLSL